MTPLRPYWSEADAAEQELLVSELVDGCFAHRDHCPGCRPCATAEAWLEHQETCEPCRAGIRVDTPTFGPPCLEYLRQIEHVKTCRRCLGPCPAVRESIEALLGWRRRRVLMTRAAALRAHEDLRTWKTTEAPTRAPERKEAA